MARKRQIYWHESFLKHEIAPGHPESPGRVHKIITNLLKYPDRLGWEVVIPKEAGPADLERVHSRRMVREFLAQRGKSFQLDQETGGNAHTIEAALRASGGAIQAVDMVVSGAIETAWVLNRPPGHHAERDRAMGFCLCNHAAVAAAYATEELGLRRVLILDPDVHHGNGTQDIFYARGDVFYLSLHGRHLFPGTGHEWEIGEESGRGATLNLPLEKGSGEGDYRYLEEMILRPVVLSYAPQLVIFSTGFDALAEDPLGGMELSPDGFIHFLLSITKTLQKGNIPYLFLLEGGYHVDAMAETMLGLLHSLGGQGEPEKAPAKKIRPETRRLVDALQKHPIFI